MSPAGTLLGEIKFGPREIVPSAFSQNRTSTIKRPGSRISAGARQQPRRLSRRASSSASVKPSSTLGPRAAGPVAGADCRPGGGLRRSLGAAFVTARSRSPRSSRRRGRGGDSAGGVGSVFAIGSGFGSGSGAGSGSAIGSGSVGGGGASGRGSSMIALASGLGSGAKLGSPSSCGSGAALRICVRGASATRSTGMISARDRSGAGAPKVT
ncbi:MAG TPA: hypothetical protein DCZ49_02280 [Hyphomonadaceae bacterium]|nr:hypothetical protein [Hyphomonadaceae bacterium]